MRKKIITLIGIISLMSTQISLNARHGYGFGSGLAGGMLGGALTSTMINAGSRGNSDSYYSGREALRAVERLEYEMASMRRQMRDMQDMMRDMQIKLRGLQNNS